ncbi:MAG: helix-turn-helix domain-containing protein, partial [Clostridia bacterium]
EEGSKAKSHSEWQAEKNGHPTWCSAIREDVDEVLAHSLSLEHFISHLRGLGYEVKTGVKHMAIRPPGKERFTRLRRLGDEYTEEAIRRRILENDPRTMPEEPLRAVGQMAQAISSPRTGRYAGSFRAPRKKVTGLRALYLWYAYRMGNVRKGGASACKTHYLLREDIRKLQKRDLMATLLVKNKIETISQLYEHREDCREMIAVLCEKRVELKKQPPTEARAAELDGIREKLKVLRREVRLCGDIETDSVAIQKKRQALRSLAAEQAKPRAASVLPRCWTRWGFPIVHMENRIARVFPRRTNATPRTNNDHETGATQTSVVFPLTKSIIYDTIVVGMVIAMDDGYVKTRQEIIQKLVRERKAQKLTQQELADRLGVLRPNLSRFERGEQNPTLDFLLRVAAALGREPDFILKSDAPRSAENELSRYEKGDDRPMDNRSLFAKIDRYKGEIASRRPLKPEEIRELDSYFRIGSTYASNALEGNTLTLSETKAIIEDGLTVGGKPLKDCYEATGHANAYDYMLKVARGGDLAFTEDMLLEL